MYMVHEAATKKLMAVGDVYPEYVTLKKVCGFPGIFCLWVGMSS